MKLIFYAVLSFSLVLVHGAARRSDLLAPPSFTPGAQPRILLQLRRLSLVHTPAPLCKKGND